MAINFKVSELDLMKMPTNVIKQRMKRLEKYKKEHPDTCPFIKQE